MHNHPTFTLLVVSAALVRHNKLFSFSRVVLRSIVALDLALWCLSPEFHANTRNHTTCQCPVKPLRGRAPRPTLLIKLLRTVAGRLCTARAFAVNRQNLETFPMMMVSSCLQLCENHQGPKFRGKKSAAKSHCVCFLFAEAIVTICSNYASLFGQNYNKQLWEQFANCDLW